MKQEARNLSAGEIIHGRIVGVSKEYRSKNWRFKDVTVRLKDGTIKSFAVDEAYFYILENQILNSDIEATVGTTVVSNEFGLRESLEGNPPLLSMLFDIQATAND